MNKKALDILPIGERRRFIRHNLSIPISYKVISKLRAYAEKDLPALTSNISMGGLLFAAKRPVKVGSIIEIKLPLKDKIFNVKSKVVHCAKNLRAKQYSVGGSFYRPGDAFRARLLEQVYLIAEYRNLRSRKLGREISLEEAAKEWITQYAERFKKLHW